MPLNFFCHVEPAIFPGARYQCVVPVINLPALEIRLALLNKCTDAFLRII